MITKEHVDALINGLVLGDIDGNRDDFYAHCLALYRTGYSLDSRHINLIHQVLHSSIERKCYRYIFGMLENAENKDGAAFVIEQFALSGDKLTSDSERPFKVAQYAVSSLIALAEKGSFNAIEYLLDLLGGGYIYFNRKQNTKRLFDIIPDEMTDKVLRDIESQDQAVSIPAINTLSRLAWKNPGMFQLFREKVGQDDINSDRYYLFVSRFTSEINSKPCDKVIQWAVDNARLGLEQPNSDGEVSLATEALIGYMSLYSKEVCEIFADNIGRLERSAYYLTKSMSDRDENSADIDEEPVKGLFAKLLSTDGHKERVAILNSCSNLGWVDLLLDAYLSGDNGGYIIKAIARIEAEEGVKWIEDLKEIF